MLSVSPSWKCYLLPSPTEAAAPLWVAGIGVRAISVAVDMAPAIALWIARILIGQTRAPAPASAAGRVSITPAVPIRLCEGSAR